MTQGEIQIEICDILHEITSLIYKKEYAEELNYINERISKVKSIININDLSERGIKPTKP